MQTIQEAIEDIKAGKMVIVTDDENRENEGDLIFAAEKATPELLTFMVRHTSGVICTPMLGERLDELDLPLMVSKNTESHRTAFTVSVDYIPETTTGISAADRAATIQSLVSPNTQSNDLARPGHIFPLRYKEGGVLVRAGHTEAAVDLARLAGLYPAGVICEIVNEDGTMARMPDLEKFANEHQLKMVTIKDLIEYRHQNETLIEKLADSELKTEYGTFHIHVYKSQIDQKEHVAMTMGDIRSQKSVLTRVHSECLTGDIFSSMHCDCGPQLDTAMRLIAERGAGVLLYMRQEGRGIGLANKIKAYKLQSQGLDTVEANHKLGFKMDLRTYGIGAQILCDLGATNLELMSNNPKKLVGLEGYGLKIVERVPIEIQPNEVNIEYLKVKKKKMGHLFKNL